MQTNHQFLRIHTQKNFEIIDITKALQTFVNNSGIQNGIMAVTSQHTTTAVSVNECEERLLVDIEQYFGKLAPADQPYLHNDLHLRDVPEDEPENAHSHLIAMMTGNSESIAVSDGKLVLGTYQSVMLLELDGPRERKVSVQIMGA
ncbi:secondary thiamine-phosphate synthase enzyme YjbQ [Pseudomonadota bacterium]